MFSSLFVFRLLTSAVHSKVNILFGESFWRNCKKMKPLIFALLLVCSATRTGAFLLEDQDPNYHQIEPKINTVNCLEIPQLCSPQATCVAQNSSEAPSTGRCICNSNFDGDGILCTPKAIELRAQNHECTNDTDCSLYGRCVLESLNTVKNPIGALPEFILTPNAQTTGRRVCGCIQNYVRLKNSSTCVHEDDAPCDLVPNCHQNANCKFNIVRRQYECDCNDNYKGDGKHCKPIIEQCDKLNNCDEKAECVFNYQTRQYQCNCLPGYFGDGYFCRSRASCNQNRTLCHANADCVFNNRLREYECVCSYSYFGDGFDCRPLEKHGEEHIIVAQGMSLLNLSVEAGKKNGKLLLTKELQTPVGLDVDCLEGFVYWADLTSKAIHRAPYNGSYRDTILQGENESPEGIAIDWISRNIYWTDSQRDVIEVMKLDGTEQKVLINTDLVEPRGIVLHPELGKMYWSDWSRTNPKIEQAAMDGTARQVLVSGGSLGLPNMLTIDYKANDLCWTDAGLRRIECIKLNGQERRIIYTPANYPFDLTISGQYVYWTDWHTNEIYKVHKNGGQSEVVPLPPGGHGRLYGIVTVPSQCLHMSNRCAVNNGNCKHLCLPNNIGGRICQCSDNAESGCSSKAVVTN